MTTIFDMISLLVPLIVLLSLVSINNGQDYPPCSYVEQITPGKPTFIFNLNYPLYYPRGYRCRWIAESDRPMKVTCHPFDIPYSDGCLFSTLMIHEATEEFGLRHCGTGDINFVSKTNKLVFKLIAESHMMPGRFFCTVETVGPSIPPPPLALTSTQSPKTSPKPTPTPSPKQSPIPSPSTSTSPPFPPLSSLPLASTPSPPASSHDDENCRCGWKNNTRIVGGDETGPNEYPMMTGLFDSRLSIVFCGASIINERQVITAAHCLKAKRRMEMRVIVGAHDISKVKESNSTQSFRIESFTIHGLYNDSTEDYDIALITIDGKIKFNEQVGPVCLPFQHAPDTFGGAIVEVLGWGSIEFASGPTDVLQKAGLSVVTNVICSKSYKNLSTRQLCTRGSGKDSCQFDSGGPVLWQNPTSRRIVAIGIISLGSICADGEPAVNTRLGAFIDWIVEKTPPGIKYCTME